MSLHTKGSHLEYLNAYKDGKIKQGLGVNIPSLDKHYRHKKRELTILVGHDNTGKTFFFTWYSLCLSMLHGVKWCIWSGENGVGQIYRDMIQMLSGVKFKDLSHSQIRFYNTYLEQYFDFVDNANMYKPDELFKIFENSGADACLIDPYTGLDRDYDWADNYKFLNKARHFTNSTGMALYINTHPNTPSGRSLYPEGHIWAGHIKAPVKDQVEGGKPFVNRVDNVLCIHRLTKHPDMKYFTLISVDKVKDYDSGGEQTMKDEPILAQYNNGLGFMIGGMDPLKSIRKEINKPNKLW
jgi:hypothetical protein